RHSIGEVAIKIGIPREVHPTKLLNGRYECRQDLRIHLTVRVGKSDPIQQWKKRIAVGWFRLDSKSHKVTWRLSLFPIHRDQAHSVTSMNLQGEQRLVVLTGHLEISRCHRVLLDFRVSFKKPSSAARHVRENTRNVTRYGAIEGKHLRLFFSRSTV